jgi:hypothetical protein
LALFDTLNDETNWSQISGALDGVDVWSKWAAPLPVFLVLGHNKWAAPLPVFFGTGQQVFGKKLLPWSFER